MRSGWDGCMCRPAGFSAPGRRSPRCGWQACKRAPEDVWTSPSRSEKHRAHQLPGELLALRSQLLRSWGLLRSQPAHPQCDLTRWSLPAATSPMSVQRLSDSSIRSAPHRRLGRRRGSSMPSGSPNAARVARRWSSSVGSGRAVGPPTWLPQCAGMLTRWRRPKMTARSRTTSSGGKTKRLSAGRSHPKAQSGSPLLSVFAVADRRDRRGTVGDPSGMGGGRTSTAGAPCASKPGHVRGWHHCHSPLRTRTTARERRRTALD